MDDLMNDPIDVFAEFGEVSAELASSAATNAPFSLRTRTLDTALAARPAEAHTRVAAAISPVDSYMGFVDSLDELLGSIVEPELWSAAVTEEFNLQELIIHLTVVDRVAAQSLVGGSSLTVDVHEQTMRAIDASDATPDVVRRNWHEQANSLAAQAAQLDQDDDVVYLGLPLTVTQVITDRAFETWLHMQDVRRLMNMPMEEPESSSLQLMTDLGARMLPFVLGGFDNAATARLVLPGDGGGTWLVPFGPSVQPSEPVVTLTMDPVPFCLLIASRVSASDMPCTIDGDDNAASWLLSHASELARL